MRCGSTEVVVLVLVVDVDSAAGAVADAGAYVDVDPGDSPFVNADALDHYVFNSNALAIAALLIFSSFLLLLA